MDWAGMIYDALQFLGIFAVITLFTGLGLGWAVVWNWPNNDKDRF